MRERECREISDLQRRVIRSGIERGESWGAREGRELGSERGKRGEREAEGKRGK